MIPKQKRNPVINNKVLPLRVSNKEKPNILPTRNEFNKKTTSVFNRLYNGSKLYTENVKPRNLEKVHKEIQSNKAYNIDDRLKHLQRIINSNK